MKRWTAILVWIAAGAISCEKDINVQPDEQVAKLVVDAQIENGIAPIVELKTSLNYFSNLDTATLQQSYLHGLQASIWDGTTNYPLAEYTIQFANGRKSYYYSNQPGSGIQLYGQEGKTYTLTVVYNGQTYTAVTTIPYLTKKIDSLWWKPAPNNPDPEKVVVMARITDPPGLGNYIRYFTRENVNSYYPGYSSVYNDDIIDGKVYSIQLDPGVDKNLKLDRDEYGYFKKGSIVTIKLCNIDKASYEFWRTWEFNFSAIGNPFSTPGKVIGNISNNALGAFCGYSAQYKSLFIPN